MKNVIFTQNNNIDGISCATLAKYVFGEDCEVVFTTQETVNEDFINFFDIEPAYDDDAEIDTYNITGNSKIKEYDNIFVADVCITGELLRRFCRAANVNKRFRQFDHHDIAFKKGVDNYTLNCDVLRKDEYGPCCSLGLFYAYLKKKHMIEAGRALKEYVEMVRICDTDDKEKATKKTEDLKYLFEAVSHEEFAYRVLSRVSDKELNSFEFTDLENDIIGVQKERQEALEETYGK